MVYLAHDLRHDRPVALKVLLPELAAASARSASSARSSFAARLQHPHILTVHDSASGTVRAGQLWYTMPFVEGESLRDRLRRDSQLPVDDAVRLAREAARALDYAHQHGRGPPGHQAREHPALRGRQHAGRRLRDRPRAWAADERLTQTGFASGRRPT